MKVDPSSPWHYRFFRRHIRIVAECQSCGRGLTEADVEEGRCPSCGAPVEKRSES